MVTDIYLPTSPSSAVYVFWDARQGICPAPRSRPYTRLVRNVSDGVNATYAVLVKQLAWARAEGMSVLKIVWPGLR